LEICIAKENMLNFSVIRYHTKRLFLHKKFLQSCYEFIDSVALNGLNGGHFNRYLKNIKRSFKDKFYVRF